MEHAYIYATLSHNSAPINSKNSHIQPMQFMENERCIFFRERAYSMFQLQSRLVFGNKLLKQDRTRTRCYISDNGTGFYPNALTELNFVHQQWDNNLHSFVTKLLRILSTLSDVLANLVRADRIFLFGCICCQSLKYLVFFLQNFQVLHVIRTILIQFYSILSIYRVKMIKFITIYKLQRFSLTFSVFLSKLVSFAKFRKTTKKICEIPPYANEITLHLPWNFFHSDVLLQVLNGKELP